jgi:hypothetical protein
MLLDPGDMGLRGKIGNREAGREAGLSGEREGRYAGSLWCAPSLAHFWQHWGRRVDAGRLHRHMRDAFGGQPVGQVLQARRGGGKRAHDAAALATGRREQHTGHDRKLVHIQTCTAGIQHPQTHCSGPFLSAILAGDNAAAAARGAF